MTLRIGSASTPREDQPFDHSCLSPDDLILCGRLGENFSYAGRVRTVDPTHLRLYPPSARLEVPIEKLRTANLPAAESSTYVQFNDLLNLRVIRL